MDIKVTLQDQRLRSLLNRLVRRGKDMSTAMDAISGVLADVVEQAFDQARAAWVWLGCGLGRSSARQRSHGVSGAATEAARYSSRPGG